MAGFRLTGGSSGCPPTATPPSGYQNPFRFDSAGRLWITSCFKNFQYFGEARQDLLSMQATDADNYNGASTNFLSRGTIKTRTITNTTQCTLGILLAHDVIVDLQNREDNWVWVGVSELWNGAVHATASVSSQHDLSGTDFVRSLLHGGAAPHDVGSPDGGSSLQLAPGASATVGCRLKVDYNWGSPVFGDQLIANSAVRIYGYVLG